MLDAQGNLSVAAFPAEFGGTRRFERVEVMAKAITWREFASKKSRIVTSDELIVGESREKMEIDTKFVN